MKSSDQFYNVLYALIGILLGMAIAIMIIVFQYTPTFSGEAQSGIVLLALCRAMKTDDGSNPNGGGSSSVFMSE